MTDIEKLKLELREKQAPFFEDEDFAYYLEKNAFDLNLAIYEMLILKSEDSQIQMAGLTTQDTSAYFKRLASKFRKFNTGTLRAT